MSVTVQGSSGSVTVETGATQQVNVTTTVPQKVAASSPTVENVATQSQDHVSVEELGVRGLQGAPGERGEQGAPGASAMNPFTFMQTVPTNEWVIPHPLHTLPTVTVVDSANRMVYGDVSYPDFDTVIITFAVPFSGTAYLL